MLKAFDASDSERSETTEIVTTQDTEPSPVLSIWYFILSIKEKYMKHFVLVNIRDEMKIKKYQNKINHIRSKRFILCCCQRFCSCSAGSR